jgi:hypothetical protein
MQFDHYEYNLAGHWLSALINNDYTGLEEHEIKQINVFTDSLPARFHWDIDDDSANYRIDAVSGDYAETYRAKLLFEV